MEPGRGHEVGAAEDHNHLYVHNNVEIVLPTDTVGHEELRTVNN